MKASKDLCTTQALFKITYFPGRLMELPFARTHLNRPPFSVVSLSP